MKNLHDCQIKKENTLLKIQSKLSSRVNKKYGAGGRILFYDFYFPKAKLLMATLFLSIKEVPSNAPNMNF
jgi:hypothetical protein